MLSLPRELVAKTATDVVSARALAWTCRNMLAVIKSLYSRTTNKIVAPDREYHLKIAGGVFLCCEGRASRLLNYVVRHRGYYDCDDCAGRAVQMPHIDVDGALVHMCDAGYVFSEDGRTYIVDVELIDYYSCFGGTFYTTRKVIVPAAAAAPKRRHIFVNALGTFCEHDDAACVIILDEYIPK